MKHSEVSPGSSPEPGISESLQRQSRLIAKRESYFSSLDNQEEKSDQINT